MEGLGVRDGLSGRTEARNAARTLDGVAGGAGSGESAEAVKERFRMSSLGSCGGLEGSAGTGGRSRFMLLAEIRDGWLGGMRSVWSSFVAGGSMLAADTGPGNSRREDRGIYALSELTGVRIRSSCAWSTASLCIYC